MKQALLLGWQAPNKNGTHYRVPFQRKGIQTKTSLFTVTADGLYGASRQGFITQSTLFIRLRLLVEEGVTTVIVTLKISGGSLTAKIAVDALIIYVVGTCDVLRIFVGDVSHDGCLKVIVRLGARMIPVCMADAKSFLPYPEMLVVLDYISSGGLLQ
jgi:hypothetical protein